MIIGMNSTPSFGSTRLPLTDALGLKKYADALQGFYTVKGAWGNKPAQVYADKLKAGNAVCVMTDKEVMMVGKDGGEGGADRFIYKILKKAFPEAKYIDDVAPIKTEGPTIDLDI